jgi:hypothetical protein
MNILIIIVVLLVAGLAVWKLLRFRDTGVHTKSISVSDIGEVYRQISTQGVETSFAVFIIAPPQWDAADTVEVQFSVEEGVTGLDWILMSEANKREKQRVVQFALRKGAEWQECEMNEWLYLRIDQGDLVELCTSLIRDLYAVEEVQLKYGGCSIRF